MEQIDCTQDEIFFLQGQIVSARINYVVAPMPYLVAYCKQHNVLRDLSFMVLCLLNLSRHGSCIIAATQPYSGVSARVSYIFRTAYLQTSTSPSVWLSNMVLANAVTGIQGPC